MMRRAFTLVELMVASWAGAIILVALSMALTGVWREAIKTNEEMQALFRASAMRERLLQGTALKGDKGFHGLLNVTNNVAAKNSGKNLYIYKADGKTEDKNERLPGTTSDLVFGKSSSGDKNAVDVVDFGSVTNRIDDQFFYTENRQRVTVYLWAETSDGTVCRMPVYLTTLRE